MEENNYLYLMCFEKLSFSFDFSIFATPLLKDKVQQEMKSYTATWTWTPSNYQRPAAVNPDIIS